ncbi:MAG: sensor histidine kinase [Bacteroidales bacterium]|nr:sensor histidine kinase [Bacteroidales bacterium]MBQ5458656.1 sensor histidine kinase [Bacteroidales bacterium]
MKSFFVHIFALLWLSVVCLAGYGQYSDHRNRNVDSLEMVLNGSNPPQGQELMKAYNNLMWGYLNTDGAKSRQYALKAIDLSYEENMLNARADALRVLGLIAYGNDDYDVAIEYYNRALEVSDSMKNDSRYSESDIDDNLSVIYGSIANVYNMQDKVHLAIHYYQKALPIFEKYGWLESTAILYYNIGELYNSMGNSDEARSNYLMAVDAAQKSGDSLLVAMSHKGLVAIYNDAGDMAKVEEAANVCYEYYRNHIEEEKGDYIVTILAFARLQMNHYKDLDRAEGYISEALSLLDDETSWETRSNVYTACCELAMARKQWKKAEEYALMSLEDEYETYDDIGVYVYLAQIYAELGNNEGVKEYSEKIFRGMAQFANSNYQSGLSQMAVLYETEKKQAAIEQLTREKRWYMIGSVLIGCIMLLVALLFFLLWRNVRKNRQNAIVVAKLSGEVAERVRIARDLHDRMGGLLTSIKRNLEYAENPGETNESILTAKAQTDEAMREMRNVAHHLLPESLKRYGLRVALGDYCRTMKNVSFSFVGDEKLIPNQYDEAVYCIVYELVNNAVKNAEANHIRVQLFADAETIVVNVSDDGNGGIAVSTEGSGMRNIKERVDAIGGTFDVCSEPGKGSEVNIEIRNK